MSLKTTALAALAALALGSTAASAQYYGDDYGGRRYERGYDRDDRGYDRRDYDRAERRRRDYDDDRYDRRPTYGARRGGSICVTARGNCVTRPAPFNSPCGCDVPGFGFKRGAIGS